MTKPCGDEFHTAHLTRAARLSLRMPGVLAWRLVLHLRIATRPCREFLRR